jgi:DNA-binding transcriptional MerR regulator/methylmalonyl-CoA mutase cobalamin-binding subunit
MYTIKQAAARTGIPVELLRAWERRYSVVAPERTASGYRLYGDAAIVRLRAMRRLVADGWSPSTAAASLREMAPEAISALAGDAGSPEVAPATPVDAAILTDRFVDAAAALDAGRIESALDEMSAQGSFEHVAGDYVLPALEALGDAWAAGRVDVAGEHAASHAALRRLAAALEAAGRQPGVHDRPVLVGLPPGSRHELGALAFAVAIRRAGIPVLYLGADLPIADWRSAAATTAARAAVVGVVTPADRQPAEQVAEVVRDARPEAVIAFGGRSAHDDARGRWMRLPQDLRDATDALTAELERLEPPGARRRRRG